MPPLCLLDPQHDLPAIKSFIREVKISLLLEKTFSITFKIDQRLTFQVKISRTKDAMSLVFYVTRDLWAADTYG